MSGEDATRATRISDPLRERRLVWRAQFCCAMGQGMGAILLTWLVLEGSHGPASVGLCIAAGLLPLGVGAAVASRRAERDDRRLLMVGAQALLALVALGLATTERPALVVIAGAALLSGLARVAFDATALSVLHHLVDEARLPRAARDLTARFHVGHLCGAALVAALVPAVAPQPMFGVCAAVFAVGAIISSRHHRDIGLRPGRRGRLDAALPRGWRALLGEARLRPLALAVLALAGSASEAAAGYGALLAAGAVLGIVINHRRTSVVADDLRVPVGLAGGVLSARAVALGAVVVGAASVPLGEQRAYLALALAGAVAGAAAYLTARPVRAAT